MLCGRLSSLLSLPGICLVVRGVRVGVTSVSELHKSLWGERESRQLISVVRCSSDPAASGRVGPHGES